MKIGKSIISILAVIFPLAASAQTNPWTQVAPIPTGVIGPSVGVINGSIYVTAGGNTALQIYDAIANNWTTGAPFNASSIYAATAGVINGKMYVAGGQILGTGNIANLEVYDPGTLSWSNLTAMPAASAALCSGVINGKLYVAGGATPDNFSVVNSLRVYDPVANSWTTLAPMPTARDWPAAAVYNGQLYIMGGASPGSVALPTVEVYDPVANTWTNKSPMPVACAEFNAAVLNGIIYTIGGTTNASGSAGIFNLVQAYNPANDTWSVSSPMPTGRSTAGVGVANGAIYAIGGYVNNSSLYATNNEAFVPSTILNLNMYAGLTLIGSIGKTNEIDYKNDLNATNWTFLTNVVMTNSPYLYIDTTSTYFAHRFYRSIQLP